MSGGEGLSVADRDVFGDITEPRRLHGARHMEGKNAMGGNSSQSQAIEKIGKSPVCIGQK